MTVREDLSGMRYGRLTVLRISPRQTKWHAYWVAICDCGREKEVRSNNLKSGSVITCGVPGCRGGGKQAKDMLGERFGRLAVMEYAGNKDGIALWKCLCDCGESLVAIGKQLRSGNKGSCGLENYRKGASYLGNSGVSP